MKVGIDRNGYRAGTVVEKFVAISGYQTKYFNNSGSARMPMGTLSQGYRHGCRHGMVDIVE